MERGGEGRRIEENRGEERRDGFVYSLLTNTHHDMIVRFSTKFILPGAILARSVL